MPGLSVKLFECTVEEVSEANRVITSAVSRKGRRFKNLSYMVPYINMLGSGLDFLPQRDDTCLVLAGDPGTFETCIGFKLRPTKGPNGGLELAGRLKSLPPGSMAIRAVGEDGSEARVIAYRGGTVVIGSGALATSVYSPLGEIKHLFDKFEMNGPGGFVRWRREKGEKTVTYEAEYRVNTDAAQEGMRVNIRIGPANEKKDPVSIVVSRRKDDAAPALSLTVTKDGEVKFNGNLVDINVLARLIINCPNIVLNGRRILPIDDPI
jgi:hypothetical protein